MDRAAHLLEGLTAHGLCGCSRGWENHVPFIGGSPDFSPIVNLFRPVPALHLADSSHSPDLFGSRMILARFSRT
jgi:hypothetical protein